MEGKLKNSLASDTLFNLDLKKEDCGCPLCIDDSYPSKIFDIL